MVVLFVAASGCTGDILTKAGVGNFGSTPAPAAASGNPGAATIPGSSDFGSDDCMKTCTQYSGQSSAQCTQVCCISDCSENSPGGADACVNRCMGISSPVSTTGSGTLPLTTSSSGFTCEYDESLIKTSSEFRLWFNSSCYYNTYCGWWESNDLRQSDVSTAGSEIMNVSPDSFSQPTPEPTPCPSRTAKPVMTPFPQVTTAATLSSVTCSNDLTQCRVFSTDYCVDLMTDVKHCGACRRGCLLANAENGCAGGKCYIKSCDKGWADCNGIPDDGCEVDLNADDNNCGSCGRVCSLPNAGHAVCNGVDENGKCEVEHCLTGWTNANGIHEDGCEAPSN